MKKVQHIWRLLLLSIVWLCSGTHIFAQSAVYDIKTANGIYTFSHAEVPQALVSVYNLSHGTFRWERSTTGPLGFFIPIPGGQSATYSFFAPLEQTTYFRRYSSQFNAYSNTIKIKVVSVNHENLNYIREHDVLIEGLSDWRAVDNLAIGQKLQTTTYLDGLGRPIQKVSRETATPSQSGGLWGDVVQFSQYDQLGRQPKQHLPYTTTTESGKFKTLPLNEQTQYYSNRYNETSPYSLATYDNSPLNRTMNVKAPGTSWAASQGNTMSYDLNEASDDVHIFAIGYTSSDAPYNLGSYAANTLFKNVHTDEQNNQVVEYTTISGQLILSKTEVTAIHSGPYDGWICTYSVYDDFGLLRYRFQPEAVKYLSENGWSFAGPNGAQVLAELCFRYEYDDKGRTVLKKAPGAAPLLMLYDARDRVVFTQDGNQRAKSPAQWTANLYDELDRSTVTLLYHTTSSAASLQTDINGAATTSPVNIVNQGSPADLVLDYRQPGIASYIARNSIEFVAGFESAAGDVYTAEIDPAAPSQQTTVSTVTYNNPISQADLNNPGMSTVIRYNFYDNYSFSTVRPFSTSFDNGLAYGIGAEPIATTERTTSMQTGSMVRVLGTSTFLSSTVYYDEKGRPIQTLEDNIKSGSDITTLQYQFDGRLLSTNTKHSTAGSGYSGFSVVTKNLFDNTGRITSIEKKVGDNPFKAITAYDLDDMGRLNTKHLSPGYTGSGGSELESLGYSYNIHNEITGINKDYALKTPGQYDKWGHYFGLYLGYDNRDGVFAQSQLGGRVTGTLWNSQGDDAQRRYDFTYDAAGRLTAALYGERRQTADNWSHAVMDFSVIGNAGKITYDLNGNLLSMLQKGVVPGQAFPQTVDDLQYSYAAMSNKLVRVTDQGTLGQHNGKLGDFADGGNTGDDYVYDDNGNLITDLNKRGAEAPAGQGAAIRYNFLDKPEQVIIPGKGTLRMAYDADGNKLEKTFIPVGGGPVVTTTYINGYVYQNGQLQYINFEEGRIRVMQPTAQNNGYDMLSVDGNIDLPGGKRGGYDFMIRDYQGNVRMVLSEQTHSGSNTCTMEAGRAANEEPVFGQVDGSGTPTAANEVKARFAASGIPGQTSGNGWQNASLGDYVSRVGNLTGSKVGPNTLLRVMAGDQVSATAQYYYQAAVVNNAGGPLLSQILSSLAQAISGSGVTSNLAKSAVGDISAQLTGSVPFGLKTEPDASETQGTKPKAYLTVLFFDERFAFVEEGSMSLRVEQPGSGAAPLVLAGLRAPRNGYAYVYVSNGSDEMVYFDNVQVAHERGRIIEESHYYAYGLRIAGISSRKLADGSEGHTVNRDLYNDKELIEDGDLNWYDYGFRSYDAQIGRFPQLDPLTDDYPYYTPYQYAGCEPIANVDVDGLEPASSIGATLSDFFQNSTTILQNAVTVSAPKLASSAGSFLSAAVAVTQNAARVALKSVTRENLVRLADVVSDFTPIAGGVKDIYYGIKEGNGWKVALGVGSIALDVVTFGGSSIAKGSIKTAVKIGAEVLIRHEAEQVAIQSMRRGAVMTLRAAQNSAGRGKIAKNSLIKFGCFVKGTLVWAKDSTTSIEKIRKGDTVHAYDVKARKVVKKKVTEVYVRQVDGLIKIECKNEVLYTTAEHPFYVRNGWVEAGVLKAGDSLFLSSGAKVVIDKLLAIDTGVTVYNISVADANDYFVSGSKILVHNNNPCQQMLSSELPVLGNKLNYLFGKATGAVHNIERSTGMLRQLGTIGIYDNAEGRAYLRGYLGKIYNGSKGVIQSNGRTLRESLLSGPNGILKMESIWEGNKLITVTLIGGR